MRRWIVNARTNEVRQASNGIVGGVEYPQVTGMADDEFFFDAPTAVDAAMAGRRHNLAVEALESVSVEAGIAASDIKTFQVVADRIEWRKSDTSGAIAALTDLADVLAELGFDVWREGLALLVLGRRQDTSGPAWVPEIGSDR